MHRISLYSDIGTLVAPVYFLCHSPSVTPLLTNLLSNLLSPFVRGLCDGLCAHCDDGARLGPRVKAVIQPSHPPWPQENKKIYINK